MLTVGIDIGSISAKAAVIRDGQLVGSKVMLTGYNAKTAGEKVFADLLAELDLEEIPRGKFDFDVTGHYARPDVFQLHVNRRRQTSGVQDVLDGGFYPM